MSDLSLLGWPLGCVRADLLLNDRQVPMQGLPEHCGAKNVISAGGAMLAQCKPVIR